MILNKKKLVVVFSIFVVIFFYGIVCINAEKSSNETFVTVINLYNYKTDDTNHVVGWDGVLSESTKNRTSDYIEVTPLKSYAGRFWNSDKNTAYKLVYYDKDKNFLERVTNEGMDYVVIPDGVYYVRIILAQSSTVFKHFVFCEGTEYYESLEYGKSYQLASTDRSEYVTLNNSDFYEFTGEYIEPIYGWNHLVDVYNMWDELMADYPEYINMEVVGEFYGNHPTKGTVIKYEIRCYTISKNLDSVMNDTSNNLKILYLSGIHGHERKAPSGDYMFFKDLLVNHDKNSALNYIWNNTDFKIIPICSPWGYDFSNRVNENEVNLNRNFDSSEWVYVEKGTDKNYSGETPSSEVETQIIEKFIGDNSDAFMAVNRHTNGTLTDSKSLGFINASFYSDRLAVTRNFRALAAKFKSNYPWLISDNENTLSRNLLSVNITSAIGNMDNYFTEKFGMHGALLEVGGGLGDGYPNGTEKEYDIMSVEVIGNFLLSYIINNKSITENVVEAAKDIYQIVYELNGGFFEEFKNPYIYTTDDTIVLKRPIKKGYVFIGWTGSNGENLSKDVVIEKGTKENLKYVANWKVASGNVSYVEGANVEVIEDKKDILRNLKINRDFSEVRKMIDTDGYISIYDKDDKVLKNDDMIKTGDKLVVEFLDYDYFIHLSVLGDVTGNGQIDNNDVDKVYDILKNKEEVDRIYYLAGDVNGDGDIKINDVAKLHQYERKKINNLD